MCFIISLPAKSENKEREEKQRHEAASAEGPFVIALAGSGLNNLPPHTQLLRCSMEEALRRARKDAVVYDTHDGSCFLALHPTYSCAPRLRTRVGLCHMSISLLSFVLFACAALGHVLPCCQTPHRMEQWYLWARMWLNGGELPYMERRNDALGMRVTAAAAAVCGLLAFVVAARLPGAWSRAESARVREEVDNKCLQETYRQQLQLLGTRAHLPQGVGGDDNLGQVSCVPLEEREQQRRRVVNRIAAAAFVFLLGATFFSVCTTACVLMDYVAVRWYEESQVRLALGFTCYLVASVCGAASCFFLLKPSLSRVRLFRRGAVVPRCRLMPVSESVLFLPSPSGALVGDDGCTRASVTASEEATPGFPQAVASEGRAIHQALHRAQQQPTSVGIGSTVALGAPARDTAATSHAFSHVTPTPTKNAVSSLPSTTASCGLDRVVQRVKRRHDC
jgi:hypothetical protein